MATRKTSPRLTVNFQRLQACLEPVSALFGFGIQFPLAAEFFSAAGQPTLALVWPRFPDQGFDPFTARAAAFPDEPIHIGQCLLVDADGHSGFHTVLILEYELYHTTGRGAGRR